MSGPDLQKAKLEQVRMLHQASVELESLAMSASQQPGDHAARAALAGQIAVWVRLVDSCAAGCREGQARSDYEALTGQLQTGLLKLGAASDPEQMEVIGQNLAPIIERWSEAMGRLLVESLETA